MVFVDIISSNVYNQDMLNTLLTQLGFSEKEIVIYLAILARGKVSPSELSEQTKIKRTTVYSIAQELLRRGVITIDLASNTQNLLALPPEDLQQLVINEEKRILEKQDLVSRAITELKNITKNTLYSIPKMTFIGEDDLEKYLYKQTPTWNKNLLAVEPIWWGFQDESFVKHYGTWIDWYWQKGVEAGISLQLLSNNSKTEREMAAKNYDNRTIRFWGEQAKFSATTWVNGDHLVMIQATHRPHYLIEIVDATLAHNQREVFKGIWRGLD